MKKIIFMGTPDFSCAILEGLLSSPYDVIGVVSQPDKKVGRKQVIQATPVKELAIQHNLPVFQPISIKKDYQDILALKPDLIVTCAYGQMIPDEVLLMPTYGSVNVHASLLPKLRGGAPIHKAIINGDDKTGISIMRMVKQMDAGAVMAQAEVEILDEDTTGMLFERLKHVGADLLQECLPAIFNQTAIFQPQDEACATFAYNISKEEEFVSFNRPLQVVYNHIRGLIPNPVGFGTIHNKKIKFHMARKYIETHSYRAGTCIGLVNQGYAIACDGGYILLDLLQMEGKAIVDAKSFYNGVGKGLIGEHFA